MNHLVVAASFTVDIMQQYHVFLIACSRSSHLHPHTLKRASIISRTRVSFNLVQQFLAPGRRLLRVLSADSHCLKSTGTFPRGCSARRRPLGRSGASWWLCPRWSSAAGAKYSVWGQWRTIICSFKELRVFADTLRKVGALISWLFHFKSNHPHFSFSEPLFCYSHKVFRKFFGLTDNLNCSQNLRWSTSE